MQNEDYALVDQYIKGQRHAINAAFCPETGWFWTVLSEAHAAAPRLVEVDDFYDSVVEAVNRELGR